MNNDNKKNTQEKGAVADGFSTAGSYFAIQKYCKVKGVTAFAYDEFEDRLPRPKKKNEPRGARIIVRKGASLKKTESEEGTFSGSSKGHLDKGKDSVKSDTQEDFSQVNELEKQLLRLMNSIRLLKVKKGDKNTYQDLLEQIYHKAGELIKLDPTRVKSPLSSELQRAYDMLHTMP